MAEPQPTNRLADETSAYLRQHMHNPVDWYPWGEEAFARARDEGKPLLVSIGYSACHWCHVMAHESFEHEESAAIMNELFVNVKVDREERPDVDQIYMDTVVRLTGHGGWPLTVFCTPDGRPFYAGTYYPLEPRGQGPTFRQILAAVNEAWTKRRDEVEESAGQILEAIAAQPEGQASGAPGVARLVDGTRQLMQAADLKNGGFGQGPKFPTPTNLEMLLAAVDHLPKVEADPVLHHCLYTGREMARRGLYDHLGGGFHRYCVDGVWAIPHFEKMLYDQGLLLRVYAELHRRSGDAEFVWPMRETIDYLLREMKGPEGGFYASQDADSEGEEGKFYVWTPLEVAAVLGDDTPDFMRAYGVDESGNFEGGTTHLIDRMRRPRADFAAERNALLAQRVGRIAPATDTKRVASWNGYTISGLARAATQLDDPSILAEAAAAADFVLDTLRDDRGRLLRVFAEGRAHVTGFLDDYAAMLDACLDLHRAGAGDRYVATALDLAREITHRFYDGDARDLFLTPDDGEPLVHRPRSDSDGATPHAAGHALLGLTRLAELSGDEEIADVVRQVLATHAFVLEKAPHAFPTLLRAAAVAEQGISVAVVVGDAEDPNTRALLERARKELGPEDAVIRVAPGSGPPLGIAASWVEGRDAVNGAPTAYVCRGTTCSLPVTNSDDLSSLEQTGHAPTGE
jgi:uncharacterized protein YyaL (SSP411 family)